MWSLRKTSALLSLTWLSQAMPTDAGMRRLAIPPRSFDNQPATAPSFETLVERGLQSIRTVISDPQLWFINAATPIGMSASSSPSDFNFINIQVKAPSNSTTILFRNSEDDPLDFTIVKKVAYQETDVGDILYPWSFPSLGMTLETALEILNRTSYPPPYDYVLIQWPRTPSFQGFNTTEIVYQFVRDESPGTRRTVTLGTKSRRMTTWEMQVGQGVYLGATIAQNHPSPM